MPPRSIDDVVRESRVKGYEKAVKEQMQLWAEGTITQEEFNRRRAAIQEAHLEWARGAEKRGWRATGKEKAEAEAVVRSGKAVESQAQAEQLLRLHSEGKITKRQLTKGIRRVESEHTHWLGSRVSPFKRSYKGIDLVTGYSIGSTQRQPSVLDAGLPPETVTYSLKEALSLGLITSEDAHRRREAGFTEAYVQWQRDPLTFRMREAAFSDWWEREGRFQALAKRVEYGVQVGLYTSSAIMSLPMSFVLAAGELDEIMGAPSTRLREAQTYLSTIATEAKGKGDSLTTILSSTGSRVAGIGASTYDILTFKARPMLWMGLGSLALSPKVREEVWQSIQEDPLQFGLEMGVGGYTAGKILGVTQRVSSKVSSWAEPQLKDLGLTVVTKTPGFRDIYYARKYGKPISGQAEFFPEMLKVDGGGSWTRGFVKFMETPGIDILMGKTSFPRGKPLYEYPELTSFFGKTSWTKGIPISQMPEFDVGFKKGWTRGISIYAIPEFWWPEFIDPNLARKAKPKTRSGRSTPFYKHFTTSMGYPSRLEQIKSVKFIHRFTRTPPLSLPAPQLDLEVKEAETKRTAQGRAGYGYSPPILTVDPRIKAREEYSTKEIMRAPPGPFKPAPITRESRWATLESPYYKRRTNIDLNKKSKFDKKLKNPLDIDLRLKTGEIPRLKLGEILDLDYKHRDTIGFDDKYDVTQTPYQITFPFTSPLQFHFQEQKTRQRQNPLIAQVPRSPQMVSGEVLDFLPRRKEKKKRKDEWGLEGIWKIRVDPLKMKKGLGIL